MRKTSAASLILSAYKPLLHLGNENIQKVGTEIPIPRAQSSTLLELCDAARRRFSYQKALVWLDGPIDVVGDLHGNLHDLVRIWNMVGNPFSRFLFLGDYVDRGSYQIEVITLLLALAVEYPSRIFLLRGNHEISTVNRNYGFYDDVLSHYSEDVWNAFNDVFTYLPLAAVINKRYFCVHGGLCPELNTLYDIESLPMPITDTTDPLISGMLWSDPGYGVSDFRRSKRGRGVNFGFMAVKTFLMTNNLHAILRAHENVPCGVKSIFDGHLITIFSSSGYTCTMDRAGFVTIDKDGNTVIHDFGSERCVTKQDAAFTPMPAARLMLVKSFLGGFPGLGAPGGGLKKTASLTGGMVMRLKTPGKTFCTDDDGVERTPGPRTRAPLTLDTLLK